MTKVVLTAVIAASVVSTGAFAAGTTAAASAPATSAQGKAPQSNSVDAALKAVCQKLEPQVREAADACLNRKDQAKRGECFEQIADKLFKGKAEACGSFFEPMKQEFMAKERQMYPNQQSAMNGGSKGPQGSQSGMPNTAGSPGQPGMPNTAGSPGQPGMPNTAGSPGQPGMPNTAGAPTTASQPGMQPAGARQGSSSQQSSATGGVKMDDALKAACQKLEPQVREAAGACLNRKDQAKRGECFEQIGDKFFKGKTEACGGFFEPMKQEFMAKERQMYPNQQSAMNGGSKGPQGSPAGMPNMAGSQSAQGQSVQPGQPGMQNTSGEPSKGATASRAPVDCSKVVSEAKKLGQACLVMANTEKRRSCWESAGDKLQKAVGSDGGQCESAMEGVKQEMMSAEGSKYPKQEKAFR